MKQFAGRVLGLSGLVRHLRMIPVARRIFTTSHALGWSTPERVVAAASWRILQSTSLSKGHPKIKPICVIQ